MEKDWALGLGWETYLETPFIYSYPYAFLVWRGKPLVQWLIEVQKSYYPNRWYMDYFISPYHIAKAGRSSVRAGGAVLEVIGGCPICGFPGCSDLEARVEVKDQKLFITTLKKLSGSGPQYADYPFMPIELPWPQFNYAVSSVRIHKGWAYWRFPKKAPRLYPTMPYEKLKLKEKIKSKPKWAERELNFEWGLKYKGKVLNVHQKPAWFSKAKLATAREQFDEFFKDEGR